MVVLLIVSIKYIFVKICVIFSFFFLLNVFENLYDKLINCIYVKKLQYYVKFFKMFYYFQIYKILKEFYLSYNKLEIRNIRFIELFFGKK